MRSVCFTFVVFVFGFAQRAPAQYPVVADAQNPPSPPSQHDHLQQAIQHLRAAGLEELAERVRRHAERLHQRELAAKREQLKALEQQVARVRAEVGRLEAGAAQQVGQRQVLVELRVLEVSLNGFRERGGKIGEKGFCNAWLQGKLEAPAGSAQQFAFGVLDKNSWCLETLETLRKVGLAKTLAEPTLVTVSGRPASYQSGGEFPVPVPQQHGDVAIEYRQFGTRVDMVAVHQSNGKLRLEIRPVISEIDPAKSVTIGGIVVPGLRVRMVDAAAELSAGQTLAVGGVIQKLKSRDEGGGQEEPQESEEVELIVLATPRFVEAPQ